MGDTTQNDNSNPGDLRVQNDELRSTNKQQADQLLAYQQDEQLREAGFSHLSKRQRATIIRDLRDEGKDLSAETAAEMAKEHGYPLTAAPSSDPNPPANDAGQGQGNGQGNGQQQSGQNEPDPDVEDSLTAMDLMARAAKIAAGNAPQTDFDAEMKGTNNPEELRDLIRKKGARHGMVHEWDVP